MTDQLKGIKRLLQCLEYPFQDGFNLGRIAIIQLINWLEDRKIRELEIDQREFLRISSIDDPIQLRSWDIGFENYLNELNCPYDWDAKQPLECLYWLVSYAISIEYEESELTSQADVSYEIKLLRTMDKIKEIGLILNIQPHEMENELDFLSRVWYQIKFYLSPAALEAQRSENTNSMSLDEFPLGFDTNDTTTNRIATVLRMMYLNDFRELQNEVNSILILGQEYTANPKLNTSLGKTGR